MLDRLEDMREDLNHNDFADEVNFELIFSRYVIALLAHLQSEVRFRFNNLFCYKQEVYKVKCYSI